MLRKEATERNTGFRSEDLVVPYDNGETSCSILARESIRDVVFWYIYHGIAARCCRLPRCEWQNMHIAACF